MDKVFMISLPCSPTKLAQIGGAALLLAWMAACSPTTTEPSLPENPKIGQPGGDLSSQGEKDDGDAWDELDELEALEGDPDSASDFPNDGSAERWAERSFSGHSQYTITATESGEQIKGVTDGQASVLYRQERTDIANKPYLSWDWKIQNIFNIPDERTKAGDDFPARIYVVVQNGLLPWDTLAINYVWSSTSTTGEFWRNPFSEKAIMVVLNSGENLSGQWVSQTRNIVADFRRFHDIDISAIDGYAYMIDGDNSGSHGVSWVRNIRFSASP